MNQTKTKLNKRQRKKLLKGKYSTNAVELTDKTSAEDSSFELFPPLSASGNNLNNLDTKEENEENSARKQLKNIIQSSYADDQNLKNAYQEMKKDVKKKEKQIIELTVLLKRERVEIVRLKKTADTRLTEINEKDGKIADLSKKLGKYEAALFSRKRLKKMEKELGCDYDVEKYVEYMEKTYGSNCKEVLTKSYHYRVFQYFIHMAPEIDDRITELRKKYASHRNAAHNFCLDMKSIYKLLSEDIHDELILLSDREFTLDEIVSDLKRLGLKPRQLTSISDFLKIDGKTR